MLSMSFRQVLKNGRSTLFPSRCAISSITRKKTVVIEKFSIPAYAPGYHFGRCQTVNKRFLFFEFFRNPRGFEELEPAPDLVRDVMHNATCNRRRPVSKSGHGFTVCLKINILEDISQLFAV